MNLHDYMDATLEQLELEIEGFQQELEEMANSSQLPLPLPNGTGTHNMTSSLFAREFIKKRQDKTLAWSDIVLFKFYKALNQTDPIELKAELLSLSAALMSWEIQLESETEPYWDRGDLDAMDTSHLEEA